MGRWRRFVSPKNSSLALDETKEILDMEYENMEFQPTLTLVKKAHTSDNSQVVKITGAIKISF
jgi:hypothetical protein